MKTLNISMSIAEIRVLERDIARAEEELGGIPLEDSLQRLRDYRIARQNTKAQIMADYLEYVLGGRG